MPLYNVTLRRQVNQAMHVRVRARSAKQAAKLAKEMAQGVLGIEWDTISDVTTAMSAEEVVQ